MRQTLDDIVTLAGRVGYVFVATADAGGLPHLASARRLRRTSDGRLGVAEWFCPGTMANLEDNRRVALVAWEAESDTGYQALGRVEAVNELAILDGFTPADREASPQMQSEWELLVAVDEVLAFSQAPHTDESV